jgi:hypothetical protein
VRTAALLLVGYLGAAAASMPAEAIPMAPTTERNGIIDASSRCGPHSYWVHRYRHHGRWIPAHCHVYHHY